TNRGAGNVKVKKDDGKIEEIKLYDGSYALVVGVSDYTNGWKDLKGVKTDVAAVKEVLEAQGFTVRTVLDPTGEQLQAALNSFVRDYGYTFGNRLLFYYAGHGDTQPSADGRKLGYIVPSDAPLPTKDLAGFYQTAISMNDFEYYALRIQAKHALFVFDSCFSGTMLTTTRSNVPPVINFKTTQPVRQFITAGSDDQEVPDVSEFRKQFVEGLNGEADSNRDGYITGSELSDFLQTKVSNYTREAQTPQYGKIRDGRLDKGDFVFIVKKNVEPVVQPSPSVAANQPKVNIEAEFWRRIENSSDADDFRDYLKAFPNGTYAVIASRELRRLEKSAKPVESPQPIKPNPVTNNNSGNAANISATKTAGAISKSRLPNGVEMSFAYIPAGSFTMGDDNGKYDDEKPAHRVTISQGFWMGQTEVTQGQWKAVMGNNPSGFSSCGDNCPVEQVSWEDAQKFIGKLNGKNDGNKYRLPTEAEWEYAARSGTTGDYAGELDTMAWYSANSGSKTHEVGMKTANGWNLYDMHGNVWEWVEDWEGEYAKGAVTDPKGAASGSARVVRGGSWHIGASSLRSASRGRDAPSYRGSYLGFRVVRY
ncbi:MAG: SUMF1/EgtB/PvdO family nonheme iron enzyme, partial [Pyrinomonadaceae bacterium]|nr:SUMF1/EgtB/PvdO family nonheme iron enzyme [Pyrinomonadaceae bacterium]